MSAARRHTVTRHISMYETDSDLSVVVAVTVAFVVRLLQLAQWRIPQSVEGVCQVE